MEKMNRDNYTRVIHGNTEIIIRELASEPDKSKFNKNQRKVAIRIDNEIYDFIIEHFGERGFSKFYNIAAKEHIKKLKAEQKIQKSK